MSDSLSNPFVGSWRYRSFFNVPDEVSDWNTLQLGEGVIVIEPSAMGTVKGTIGGPGWSLALTGDASFGYPNRMRFQGKGVVNGEEWIYDYECWLAPHWPNGVQQVPALVGTIVRTINHSSSSGGTSPAGVTASWYAVRMK